MRTRSFVVMAFAVALCTQVLAAEAKKATLNISGSECAGCAKAITAVLEEAGVKLQGKLAPSKNAPARVQVMVADDVDLGAIAAALGKVEKPHPDQPAEFAVVLFATLDKDSAKKAGEALGKVKGVDKKGIKADDRKGEISVKIAGSEKVTAATLIDALKKDAGIVATLDSAKP